MHATTDEFPATSRDPVCPARSIPRRCLLSWSRIVKTPSGVCHSATCVLIVGRFLSHWQYTEWSSGCFFHFVLFCRC